MGIIGLAFFQFLCQPYALQKHNSFRLIPILGLAGKPQNMSKILKITPSTACSKFSSRKKREGEANSWTLGI